MRVAVELIIDNITEDYMPFGMFLCNDEVNETQGEWG